MQSGDLNSQLPDHQSSPISTRPGLPPVEKNKLSSFFSGNMFSEKIVDIRVIRAWTVWVKGEYADHSTTRKLCYFVFTQSHILFEMRSHALLSFDVAQFNLLANWKAHRLIFKTKIKNHFEPDACPSRIKTFQSSELIDRAAVDHLVDEFTRQASVGPRHKVFRQ